MKGPIKEALLATLIASVKYVADERECNTADIREGSVVHYRRKIVSIL